jgi:hypothetical protein
MPTPSKPCEGTLNPETHESLRRNRNREQWGNHSCATCGRVVGVELVMGKWVPVYASDYEAMKRKRRDETDQKTGSDYRPGDEASATNRIGPRGERSGHDTGQEAK